MQFLPLRFFEQFRLVDKYDLVNKAQFFLFTYVQ